MKLTFVGFGEAARAFADSLSRQHAIQMLAAFDLRDDQEMRDAVATRGLACLTSPAGIPPETDWIISAVTADQSYEAADAVAPFLRQRQVFIDINSVSPDRKRQTAALVTAHNAIYIDMAVMAPVMPNGHATPTLIAGPTAGKFAEELAAVGFRCECAGDTVGDATAVKMVRSLFVKGLEAITVETLLAASASGCLQRVMSSLIESYPGLNLAESSLYMFERTMRHGARRAAEMRESAATINALGLNGGLAEEIAAVQACMGAIKAKPPTREDREAAIRTIATSRRDIERLGRLAAPHA